MTLNDLNIENKPLQGNVMMAKCPSREIFQHLTSRWSGLVLIVLLQGTKRFGELRRQIDGINERMLTQTLQQLEQDGLIDRKDFQTIPPHVEYSLTPLGKQAGEHLKNLVDWLQDNLGEILAQKEKRQEK